jgi:uncharacterized protein YajQ (UPF0234 family)
MSAKLKPSVKEYIKVNNKITNRFRIKHHTPSSTSTDELIKMYEGNSFKRKKEIIKKELIKRGIEWENLKKK